MSYNMDKEVADTRDTFIDCTKDYIKELAQIPEFIELYAQYKDKDTTYLSTRLLTISQRMESGLIREEDEEKAELEMVCCSLAIEDKVKRHIKTLKYKHR